MNSRLAFDLPRTARVPKSESCIYLRNTWTSNRTPVCHRVGVVNPPPGPLAVAFTSRLRRARHQLARLLFGPPKGGV